MEERKLYAKFGELFDINDSGEHDNGVETVVNALFATHTVAELEDMYNRIKALKDAESVKTLPKLVLTNISLYDVVTKEDLVNMAPNTMFAHGVVSNSPEGIYMTNSNIGRVLKWCAVRRGIPEFSVYVLWDDEHEGYDYVKSNGDTVFDMNNVKKLVSCTDEVLKMYAQ